VEAPLGQLINDRSGADSIADCDTIKQARITVVVPVLNAMRFLPQTVHPLLEAARKVNSVEVLYVDNGSSDGSHEYLRTLASKGVQVKKLERPPDAASRNLSAAARNFGARQSRGEFLSFLDADCVVAKDYFGAALAALDSTGAAATGCETHVPPDPPWIEATWHDLHYVGRERAVHYLNSANFFISRRAFDDIGGFRDDLPSGADAEIGQRLTRAGYRIHESPAVGAVHLGNPKSLREFYRRNVWHAMGMLGTVNRRKIDKPAAMTLAHLLATVAGLTILVASQFSPIKRLLIAALLQLAIPGITVAYRASQTGRSKHLVEGIYLYWLYYWARVHALVLLALGKNHQFAK
jgi:glycosyltransferase involved in cell wall biosynthesis